ncbi:chloride channel protein, CIC family [Thermotomaculum hydrothermale]|uniref:Chloride channel protein, CIC family n=1 Tax=Thermotomaculum hydrothermale TaxID=981385 RepID=A0A7R6PMX0_9BACT|nr:chloride channel protein [Thermotomaculum hydrothermale]BBB32528.1 chloride channel protein, CIC family [Thermotomaculum hydrothermale]
MKRLLKRFTSSTTTYFLLIAAVVGFLSGVGNFLLVTFTKGAHYLFFTIIGEGLFHISQGGANRFFIILIPVLGSLTLIPVFNILDGIGRGYSFPKFIAEVHLKMGKVNIKRLFAALFASSLCIGSGGSAGREGPIAVIGGAIGSLLSKVLNLKGRRRQILVGCGVAGGIAATFNAPITGVLFAEEIVFMGEMKLNTFSLFVISSVASTTFTRVFLGQESIFKPPAYLFDSVYQLPLYGLLGVFVGMLAAFYKRSFFSIEDYFDAGKIDWKFKLVIGAFLVGLMGFFMPEILSDGYDVIHDLIYFSNEKFTIIFLFFLLVLKIFATDITLGSGGSGGLFAPSLFIGAVLGALCGAIYHQLFPNLIIEPGAYAVVAMGAFLAASTHAPLTAIFLLLELTSNYQVILPIMLASIIGTIVSMAFEQESLDTRYFKKNKIPLEHAKELMFLQSVNVKEILRKDFFSVKRSMTLGELIELIKESPFLSFPVVDEANKVIGMITLNDIKSFMFESELWKLVIVDDIKQEKFYYLTLNDDLSKAQELFDFYDVEELPVVDENMIMQGIITRHDFVNFTRKRFLVEQSHESTISEL